MRVWALAAILILGAATHTAAQVEPAPAEGATDEATADTQLRARALFMQGREAFDAGRYEQALERFEAAYALSERPELLYNVGLAADRLREDERALEAFERYLNETADGHERSEQRAQVERRVAALRAAAERERNEEQQAAADARVQADANRARDDDGSVLGRWWFWTGVALVVAGGVTAAVLLTRPDDEPSGPPEPNTGLVVPTLRWSGP